MNIPEFASDELKKFAIEHVDELGDFIPKRKIIRSNTNKNISDKDS